MSNIRNFYSKIEKPDQNGCWNWKGSRKRNGTGEIRWRGGLWPAHKLSWVNEFGEVPDDKVVKHRCKNNRCVNPDHLYLANRINPHSTSKKPEYRHWINMKSRCLTPSSTGWEHYGGRGIKVCRSWAESFERFYADMGPRPSPKHSIDRIDPNGHYEPSNCRWASAKTQTRNQRANHIVRYRGRSITLAEAAESAPVPYNTVLYRLKRGWKIEDAIERHPQKGVRP